MEAADPSPISIEEATARLGFLADRSPTTSAEDARAAFAHLSDYRDSGVFVGHWAGSSEWERHAVGDEIVMVLGGRTTIFYLGDDSDRSAELTAGEIIIVPQGTWHRFETPEEVMILSVTPLPTEHSSERPSPGL